MLRDITLGQYYPADSVIHKLDPRVKLAGTMVFIISLFAFHSIEAYIVATLALAAVIRISKVPFRFMVRGLKSIILLLLITVVFNLFLIPGTPVVHFWKLTVTREGIETAVAMAVRLVYLIGRLVRHDTDDHAEQSDGRSGKGDAPAGKASRSDTRYRDDDVDRTAFHSDSAG